MSTDQNPIPPVTRDDPAAHSGDVVAENVAALKALFPSIVTDGKVDLDVLRQLLGDEVEDGAERYGLNWKGKARARAFALTPSLGTLRPAKEDSKDWDTTKNIVIEGDNLEVLKLLRKSYAGKVKLIYIDPPYNTGKDFVYPDNYTESLANYEALTGQRGADGARLTSNKETSGRFHTDWLNMMHPRLSLAKELLTEDGLIFVSCDDGELENLRLLIREILGYGSIIAQIIWRKRSTPPNDKKIGANHDYIVVCSVSHTDEGLNLRQRSDEQTARYQNPDDHPKGPWAAGDLMANVKGGRYGATLNFPIVNPATGEEHWPGARGNWRFNRDKIAQLIENDEIYFGADGKGKPKLKRFLADVKAGVTYPTIWDFVPLNTNGSNEMRSLFGDPNVFESPKPVGLIQEIVAAGSGNTDLVLDFFAGSGTTGHAVMAQNAADGGSRRYIVVQLPEQLDPKKSEQNVAADFCDKLGKLRNIAELTKERLRRAGAHVQAEHSAAKLDTGFRVYKLATSNLKPWQPGDDLTRDLLDSASNVLDGRSEDDLLVELLLKTGIDLALPGETREIAGRTVHLFGGGTLVVCLADIPATEAGALGDGIADWLDEVESPAPTTFFFRDSGFDPKGEHSAESRANLAATLRQRLGEDAIEKLGSI